MSLSPIVAVAPAPSTSRPLNRDLANPVSRKRGRAAPANSPPKRSRTLSSQSLFFAERREAEQKLADAATLANVRDNHLRAAAAWDVLANRSVKGDRLRAEEQRRKEEIAATA